MWARGYIDRDIARRYPGDVVFHYPPQYHYGFWRFTLDVFLTMATSGFWLIWIFVREMRKR